MKSSDMFKFEDIHAMKQLLINLDFKQFINQMIIGYLKSKPPVYVAFAPSVLYDVIGALMWHHCRYSDL